MTTEPVTLTFVAEKTTKNTIRFQELDEEGRPVFGSNSVIGMVYVQKSAFSGKAPKTIRVTLEEVDG